jgi:Protein of unknown function (DUF2752)
MKARLDNRRIQWLGLVGTCLCVSTLLYCTNPDRVTFFPRCLIQSVTGFYCPGCGATRALHHITHCNLQAAIRLNALSPLIPLVLAYSFTSITLETFRGTTLPKVFATRRLIVLLTCAVLAFAILRNIPYYPFDRLAPHEYIPDSNH